MSLKYQCSPDKRKQEVVSLLNELNLEFEFLGENQIKILGKYLILGEFLPTGHVYLFKYNDKWKKNTHKWTCAGIQAITSYLKQHAL
ncbi:hypothetical protein JOD29_003410 [Lysinibacillus composti]|uniref:NERD domain-containing protein n=1 Tax=Lysinibacillus composti TaxID=720633 RepID=A0A3N9U9Q7_9BACI|nr:hypothetical protein [Lysinibacillus composti]MBM7610131.1 hypothetical protein [Lysinibacillus composti]RQW73221.1 hypothetical protein EBB45_17830 [Lysinibacillus composti]